MWAFFAGCEAAKKRMNLEKLHILLQTRKGGDGMTTRQKITVGVAMLLLVVLLAGIFFYLRRPVSEPEGLLIYVDKIIKACEKCGGGFPWHSR